MHMNLFLLKFENTEGISEVLEKGLKFSEFYFVWHVTSHMIFLHFLEDC